MRKRTAQCKTYGRSALSSKQTDDFDKVFKSSETCNSRGSSPFCSSDSSAGKSMDCSATSGPYNFRRKPTGCGEKNYSESFLSKTPEIQADKGTVHQVLKQSTQRDRTRRAAIMQERKKNASMRAKNKRKENSPLNLPDYEAIAQDSFVVESENDPPVAKCSTPVTASMSPFELMDQGEKMPTPISRVLRSSTLNQTDDDSRFISEPFNIDKDLSMNVTRRRSSKLKNIRKILVDEKCLEDSHSVICIDNSIRSPSKHCSSHQSADFNSSANGELSVSFCSDDGKDDLLKSIGEINSRLVQMNFSLTSKTVDNETPPESNVSSEFDASEDLYGSSLSTRSNDAALPCISEGNESKFLLSNVSMCEPEASEFSAEANSHLSQSFYDKLRNRSICESEIRTAEEKLLEVCEQEEYISFSSCIPSCMMSKCVKIGEGVYGEVFRSVSRGKNVAIKIIPMEGNFTVNDCPQKTFDEILPEAVIAKELSDLGTGKVNMNFCQVNRMSCVKGTFPAPLLKQWDDYAKRKVSENDRPDMFSDDQLFMVFEFLDGGAALESHEMASHRQSLSVLRQVVCALAVAENAVEFEHRDLHIGNVLVRSSQETDVVFRLAEDEIRFPSEGVFATIIDFTISRLKKDGCAVFCDISTDDGLFEGSGDIQFDVYRDMKNTNGNNWSQFCPYTNVLWIKYLCAKLLNVIKVKDTGRAHRDSQRKLRQLNEVILNYQCCLQMALDEELWEC